MALFVFMAVTLGIAPESMKKGLMMVMYMSLIFSVFAIIGIMIYEALFRDRMIKVLGAHGHARDIRFRGGRRNGRRTCTR